MSPLKYVIAGLSVLFAVVFWATFLRGDGGLTRLTSLSGVYAICHPKEYPSICYGIAGTDALSCHPYDGACK